MDIVTTTVTNVLGQLMVHVKNHLDYMIFCTKHVTEMRTKMKDLNAIKSDVKDHEDENKCKRLKVPAKVTNWLDKVEKIDAQVKEIDSDVVGCLNLKVRHKLGRKAFKIIPKINGLIIEEKSFNWIDIPIPPAEVNSTKASTSTPSRDYNDFKSRKSIYMEAFNALKADNKPYMIALCGMGGVGKTTMMEKLQKAVRENNMFEFVIKITIGARTDVSEYIQTAIAEQLSIDLKDKTKEARVDKLRNAFEGRSKDGKKKFLLILDDLWEKVDLQDIGLSPKLDQGIDFKVLLTSRDKKWCMQMGVECDSILNLEVIKDSEAQDFFFQFAKDDGDLGNIGCDIAIKCGGLPIAIKTIASTLNGASKHVWEDTLSKLEHKDVREVAGEIFAISYEHLHDEETRLTLLLCGLFPEDFDTPTEDLVRYGFGLKLFRNVDSIREARNRLNTCIDQLIHANLLIQSQKVGCVKMHDLVLAFVLNMCSEGEHASVVGNKWPTNAKSESRKRISLTCAGMHDFPMDIEYTNLLLLKLMHGDESLRFPEGIYKGMKNLQVIAYDKMEYPLHLRSLQCSANLRTLCLHQCSLMSDCSSIGNISNLEVLSLAYSSIHKLPSTIGKLDKLKLLDLTDCRHLCIDNGILKSLDNLEELYMRGVRRQVNVEELVECSENLGALEIEFFDEDALPQNLSFKNLKRFRISLGCRLDKIGGQSRYSFENTLMLVTNKCELLDSGMNELFEKTKVLYLHVNGISDLGDGRGYSFHNLRVLRIYECTDLRYLFTTGVANGLKQLESLEIDKCSVLETLVDSDEISEAEVITFPALKLMSLRNLPMLMSLSKGGIVIELPQLEHLELQSLPSITSIYQDFLKKEVMNSRLKKLKINNMEKLKEIWPAGDILSQLSNNNDHVMRSQLREIEVEGCDSLVNLFPSNPMSLLHHLEDLEVRKCGSIDVIFNIDLGSSSCVVGGIKEDHNSNLRSIKVFECGELREVWRVKGVNDDLPILGFQNVECIEIYFCKSLRNVFTPTTSNFDMKALTKITLFGNVWEEGTKSDNSHIDTTRNSLKSPSIPRLYEMVESSQVKEINVVAFPSYLIHKQPPLLPHLKELTLERIKRMTHVWKYDRNQFLISQQEPISSSFLNLTSIQLYYCHSMKCLFSPLMAKLLPNLKSITIYHCDALEEVVSNIDDEYEEIATSISSHTNTTFFPHLDILYLYGLKSLKCIDGVGANRLTSVTATSVDDKFQCSQVGGAYSSFCRYLKTIRITNCDSLREIFEIEGANKDVVGDITDIGEGSSDTSSAMTIIPGLRNTTLLELPNLKELHIEGCHDLKYIFTSSTIESLKKLQELTIKNCSAMQVIVKHEDNNGLIIASSKDVMVFPRLKSLTLGRLPNLKGFFLGKNKFRWPLLDKVEMYGCPQMMIFTSGVSEAPKLKYIHTGVGKHSLECGLNFDWTNSLQHEEIQLYNSRMCSTSDITEYLQFPWSFSNLIEVDVTRYHKLTWKKEIFPSIDELVKVENVGDIEEAVVDKVVFEGTNDETQSNKKPQLLMTSMDHPPTSSSCIWKIQSSNLSNLTKVSLDGCWYLEHVFSYGMAANLVQLQDLRISHCRKLKVIVDAVQDYSETNKAKEVVSFPCLKSLQLDCLRSLKGFYLGSDEAFQWPSLHTLKIIKCPRMMVFTKGQSTTPKLKVIRTSFGLCEATEDLNSFIRTTIQEGYEF